MGLKVLVGTQWEPFTIDTHIIEIKKTFINVLSITIMFYYVFNVTPSKTTHTMVVLMAYLTIYLCQVKKNPLKVTD